jgi:hypothetical protein
VSKINIKEFINAKTTPLASIFGSGFLVMVPILVGTVGIYYTFCYSCRIGYNYENYSR